VSTERWCETVLRRVLSRRVSVEAMIEFALWMAIPYIVVGLVFAFFGVEQVQLIETQLQTRLPAGSGSHLRCHFCLPLSWCFGRCLTAVPAWFVSRNGSFPSRRVRAPVIFRSG
jgi:hypothetical protein